MILTWLWKMFLAFRRDREAPAKALPAPQTPELGFVNRSSDTGNSKIVVFDGEA